MLDVITYLDLETTGATPLHDRITEIALVRFEQGVEVARWQTLVNPEQAIPIFIQHLTGINNDMVASAPTFAQVADTLLSFLEGAVLAAHNVRFDHGFIKSEFKRLGITLRQKVLCTVKLSRLLYPEYKSHGLDAIVQRHHIANIVRHRAMGDVQAMLAFVDAARMELGEQAIYFAVQKLMSAPSLPPHLDAHLLDDLPESPGVYLFYGDNNLPLYIGKSVNLRARVLSHFNSDHASTKEMRISQEIKHIEWITTAGEFSALLLESRLIKERQPIHNRRLRNERQLCTWQLSADPQAVPLVTLVREEDIDPSQLGTLYGTFKTKRQATEVLRTLAEKYQLCPKYLGLESWAKGTCFSHQIKRCNGVCCGKEIPDIHYLRLQQALIAHRIKIWPFPGKVAIKEHNGDTDLTQLHVFEHWTYLGAADSDEAVMSLCESVTDLKFDRDMYKLLLKAFNSPKTQIIQLPNIAVEMDLY
jgi:DNA polymerase-3 subunit epsilon